MDPGTLPNFRPLSQDDMGILQNGFSALNAASATDDLNSLGDQRPVIQGEADYDSDDPAYRSNDEEVSRLVQNKPRAPRKISEKKKIEQASFAKWLDNNRTKLTKQSGKRVINDEQSVEYLVKNWEGQSIINQPRDYQLELFERAKEKNTIAVLDTGKLSATSPQIPVGA